MIVAEIVYVILCDTWGMKGLVMRSVWNSALGVQLGLCNS